MEMEMEMEMKQAQVKVVPHVLMLPFPAQGHVKPMLTLAKLLCHGGLHVTLLNTHHNHTRLNSNNLIQALSTRFPNLHFDSISDGLPDDHPRNILRFSELVSSIKSVTKPHFRELLIASITTAQQNHRPPPVTCIIADGIMSFAIDVAEELGIPVITFRTFSACCLWFYLCLPKLVEDGDELPFQEEDDDMEKKFTGVAGMEEVLRRRDLPSICRMKDVVNNPIFQFFVNEATTMTRASSLILNTFDDLESSILSRITTIFPQIYTIGPLSALLKSSHIQDSSSNDGSFLQEDRDCIAWLESQPSKSVMYVSFGSLAMMTRVQLLEIWYGLVNSGKRFLWAVRSDSINGDGGEVDQRIPVELEVGTKERGLMVEWAPQEEVLEHWAVGGFLTHSGWNSTMEGIVAGIPMICWPQFADQQINSRWVSHVWRIGLDMKDTCDREIVEKMVRELMDDRRDELMKSAGRLAGLAHASVAQGGSSYQNLEKLIEDIRNISH